MTSNSSTDIIKDLFSVGAHIGYSKSRRHPSMAQFVYGMKDSTDIIDLTKTKEKLEEAQTYLSEVARKGGTILLLGGKPEAREAIRLAGEATGMPYVAGRWIGGTFTNFAQIRKQVDKLQSLREDREKGELGKYTKREQLAFDREIEELERLYAGLIPLSAKPDVIVVIDPRQEHIAVREAQETGVPVVAVMNTDCSTQPVAYSIPANDHAKSTIDYIVNALQTAIEQGRAEAATSPKDAGEEGAKAAPQKNASSSAPARKETVRAA